jgi:histidinol dehydrogenase
VAFAAVQVLVVADAGANPGYVAADLLSQAEHGPDSQVRRLRRTCHPGRHQP